MKEKVAKTGGVSKGAPSGLIVSILVHAGAFALAGLLVVFTVVNKEEKTFEPPTPVERPKMKLKKPKVQIKKNSRPKASSRIVTKVQKASMPDIQLPEMSGMGDTLVGGMGGFDLAVDLGEVTIFGNSMSTGNDLVGTFYDVKRDRKGRRIAVDTDGVEWRGHIRKFLMNDWKPSTFSRFYRAPKKLYATSMVVPATLSGIAPQSFGDEDAIGALWMVHYQGQITHNEGIKFRFWGQGDEFLLVRVGGEIVLGAWWPGEKYRGTGISGIWESSSLDSDRYYLGNERAVVGDWIELAPGETQDIDILIGDNGGGACFLLTVQEEGVEYPRGTDGIPVLPAFKTGKLTHDFLDLVYKELPDHEIDLVSGPIFNDFSSPSSGLSVEESSAAETVAAPPVEKAIEPAFRMWTLTDERVFEADFINIIGDKVVFRTRDDKQRKIPLEDLSEGDQRYLALSNPPKLNLNFTRNVRQVGFSMNNPYAVDWWQRPPEDHARFGVRVKQTSAGYYDHELTAEVFAIGVQRTNPDKRFILLDRQSTTFNLTRENGRKHEFKSNREVVLTDFTFVGEPRGEKFFGHLIVVRDERGEIIAVDASNDWLSENRKELEHRSIGQYFEKDCKRAFPGRPRPVRLNI